MKKIIVMVIVLAIIGGATFAGDNQSAKYIRMLAREAGTDSIDAVLCFVSWLPVTLLICCPERLK